MYYTLLFLHFIYSAALHGSKPIVSLYANTQGASALIIGLLVTSYSFFPMLIAIKVGQWLDQYGAKKLILFGATFMIFAITCPILFPNIAGLFILQVLIGFAQIFITVAIQKTVGNLEGSRDQLIATLSFVASLGSLIGPLATGYIYQHLGFRFTFFIILLFIIVSWVFSITIRKEKWPTFPHATQGKKTSSLKMLKKVNLRNALIIGGLSLYSKELFVAYFPILASNKGVDAGTIGLLISLSGAASMIVRFIQAKLVNSFGRGNVLLTTLIISSISYVSIPLLKDPIIISIFVILLGAGLGLGQPLSLVYALNSSPPERQGEVLGIRLTFNRAAQVIAPLLFGTLGSISGVNVIFWASGAFLLFGTYFTRSATKDFHSDDSI